MDWITTWDFAILDWIQAHLRCGAADQFFSTITHLADGGVFWILLAVVLLVIPKTRRFRLSPGPGPSAGWHFLQRPAQAAYRPGAALSAAPRGAAADRAAVGLLLPLGPCGGLLCRGGGAGSQPCQGVGLESGAGDSAGPFAASIYMYITRRISWPVRWSVPWPGWPVRRWQSVCPRAGRKKSSLTWPTDPARRRAIRTIKENAASALSQRCRGGVFILLWGPGQMFSGWWRVLRQRFFSLRPERPALLQHAVLPRLGPAPGERLAGLRPAPAAVAASYAAALGHRG